MSELPKDEVKSAATMTKLTEDKVDYIIDFKLNEQEKNNYRVLHEYLTELSKYFNWTCRIGYNEQSLLIFLQLKSNIKHDLLLNLMNVEEFYLSKFGNDNHIRDYVNSTTIPHDNKFNKTLIQSITSNYVIDDNQLLLIQKNFGLHVGYYFIFLRTYFRSLFIPSIVGLINWKYGDQFNLYYGLFISIWSCAFVEYWKIREKMIAIKWNCEGSKNVEMTRENVLNKNDNWLFRELKILISIPILLIFAMLLISLLTFIFMIEAFGIQFYNGPYKSYISLLPTVLFCVLVPQLINLYQPILKWLSKWENHRTFTDFDSSLTLKMFTINSLVSYGGLILTAFIYIPFGNDIIKYFSEKILNESTSQYLDINNFELDKSRIETQLFAYMVTSQAVNAFQEIGMPFILKYVKKKTSKPIKVDYEEDDSDERDYLNSVREEVQKEPYDIFEDYAEMTTQFGYVSLWSLAWSLAPLMALINNFFEIRSDAFKLITHNKRSKPLMVDSIGPWLKSLSFLSYLGFIINFSMILIFNETFKTYVNLNKASILTSILIVSHLQILLKSLFKRFFTLAIWDNSSSAAIIRDRILNIHQIAKKDLLNDDNNDEKESNNLLNDDKSIEQALKSIKKNN